MQKKLLIIAAASILIIIAGRMYMQRGRGTPGSTLPAPAPAWKTSVGKPVRTALALGADGTIYSIDSAGMLSAVNPKGEILWQYDFERRGIGSEPVIGSDGAIYAVTLGKLMILEPTGKMRAEHEIRSTAQGGVGLTDTRLYASCARGDMCAWSLDPFVELVWRIRVGQNHAPPLLHGPRSTVIGFNHVIAVGTRVPPHLWSFPADTELLPDRNVQNSFRTQSRDGSAYATAFSATADGVTYIVRHSGLVAMDANGAELWQYKADPHGFVQPVVAADGTIYVLADARLVALNPHGTKRWHVAARGARGQPILGSAGTIFFAQEQSLRAVSPDGKEKWQARLDGVAEAPTTLSDDGTLYVATDKGTLYAFPVGESLMASSWPKYQGNIRNSGQVNLKY